MTRVTGATGVTVLKLRDRDLMWREVDDEVVVLDLRSSVYISLNRSGRFLWLRLAEGATEAELVEALSAAYDLASDVAQHDVAAFLEAARSQGLLA